MDDSPIVRERLIALLAELSTVEVVGQAGSAFEAVHAIRKLKPSAVVLDISMPGGSGILVLETLKREKPSPVVIILTNFSQEPYRQRCRELGADFFFDKSTEFEKVMDVLRGVRPPGPKTAREKKVKVV